MEAVAWTAIAVLAASMLGNVWWLSTRIDSLATRIDSLAARMDAGFDRVDARFDQANSRIDAHLERHW